VPDLPALEGLTRYDADRVYAFVAEASADSAPRVRVRLATVRRLLSRARAAHVAVVLADGSCVRRGRSQRRRRARHDRSAARRDGLRAPRRRADCVDGISHSTLIDPTMHVIRSNERGEKSGRKRTADLELRRDMLRAIDGDTLHCVRVRALLAILAQSNLTLRPV